MQMISIHLINPNTGYVKQCLKRHEGYAKYHFLIKRIFMNGGSQYTFLIY